MLLLISPGDARSADPALPALDLQELPANLLALLAFCCSRNSSSEARGDLDVLISLFYLGISTLCQEARVSAILSVASTGWNLKRPAISLASFLGRKFIVPTSD